MKMYRQGDILIMEHEIPPQMNNIKRDHLGRLVLAFGEATGHAHAIKDKNAELKEGMPGGFKYLRVLNGSVDLMHDEHKTITIPEGDYLVRRQREFDEEEIRYVND